MSDQNDSNLEDREEEDGGDYSNAGADVEEYDEGGVVEYREGGDRNLDMEPYDDEDIDDIGYDEGDEGDEGSDLSDLDEESDEEERTKADLHQALEEREHLTHINKERQRKCLLVWDRDRLQKRSQSGEDKMANDQNQQNADQLQSQYYKTLDQLNILWDKLDQRREDAEEKIDRLTTKLDRQDEKATELSDSFKAFKREIAREARHSRTGKPVKLKRILAFEAAEETKDREVAEVRLKHINLLNQLKQLEDQVKEKEELAVGLHLIDFEQLKIENQTLNEKIEERNDELHKLRKKTTTTVQVLTHIKEKLQFVQQENKVLESELGVLDVSVTELRDKLTKAKKIRDGLRIENSGLKQKQGFIGSDLLVSDFEGRKGELTARKAQVTALKVKHAKLSALVEKAQHMERQMNRHGPTGTRVMH